MYGGASILADRIIKPAYIADEFWSVEEIRYCLTEAAQTLRRMPVPKGGFPAGHQSGWPDVVHDWMAYAYTPATIPRTRPTAEQIDKLDRALGWLHWLTRDQRMILWARANGWTWRMVEQADVPKHRQERQLRTICHDGERRILHTLNDVDSPFNQRRSTSGGEGGKISIAGTAGNLL